MNNTEIETWPIRSTDLRAELRSAVIDHLRWRRNLVGMLGVDSVSLNAAEVRLEDQCPLGVWLAKANSKHRDTLIYQSVGSLHRAFHIEASCLVQSIDSPALIAEQWARMDQRSDDLVAALNEWREALPDQPMAGHQSVRFFDRFSDDTSMMQRD